MERFARAARVAVKYAFDVRVLYALTGILLSICAHELVHVLIHLGGIHSIRFFPNLTTIVAMNVTPIQGLSINQEEAIAYAVTVLVQFVTIIDVLAIHDSRNRKTSEQVLFGSNDTLSERERGVLLQLVSK